MRTEGASYAELERQRDATIRRFLMPVAIIGVALWLCVGHNFTTVASGAQYDCGSPYQSVQDSAVAVPTGLVFPDAKQLNDIAALQAGNSGCREDGWRHIEDAIPIALIGLVGLWFAWRRYQRLDVAANTALSRENAERIRQRLTAQRDRLQGTDNPTADLTTHEATTSEHP